MTLFIKTKTCFFTSNVIPRLTVRILQSNNLLDMAVTYSFADYPIIKLGQ